MNEIINWYRAISNAELDRKYSRFYNYLIYSILFLGAIIYIGLVILFMLSFFNNKNQFTSLIFNFLGLLFFIFLYCINLIPSIEIKIREKIVADLRLFEFFNQINVKLYIQLAEYRKMKTTKYLIENNWNHDKQILYLIDQLDKRIDLEHKKAGFRTFNILIIIIAAIINVSIAILLNVDINIMSDVIESFSNSTVSSVASLLAIVTFIGLGFFLLNRFMNNITESSHVKNVEKRTSKYIELKIVLESIYLDTYNDKHKRNLV